MADASLTCIFAVMGVIGTNGFIAPVAIPAFIAEVNVVLYGGSELVEGINDIRYGSIKDVSTVAFNPIRDTYFQGNDLGFSIQYLGYFK